MSVNELKPLEITGYVPPFEALHLLTEKAISQHRLAKIVFNRTLVVKPESCSRYYSAHQMVKRQNIDFNKEFEYRFHNFITSILRNSIS